LRLELNKGNSLKQKTQPIHHSIINDGANTTQNDTQNGRHKQDEKLRCLSFRNSKFGFSLLFSSCYYKYYYRQDTL